MITIISSYTLRHTTIFMTKKTMRLCMIARIFWVKTSTQMKEFQMINRTRARTNCIRYMFRCYIGRILLYSRISIIPKSMNNIERLMRKEIQNQKMRKMKLTIGYTGIIISLKRCNLMNLQSKGSTLGLLAKEQQTNKSKTS